MKCVFYFYLKNRGTFWATQYILLSERSQSEKTTYCMIQLLDMWKKQAMEIVKNKIKNQWFPGGLGERVG